MLEPPVTPRLNDVALDPPAQWLMDLRSTPVHSSTPCRFSALFSTPTRTNAFLGQTSTPLKAFRSSPSRNATMFCSPLSTHSLTNNQDSLYAPLVFDNSTPTKNMIRNLADSLHSPDNEPTPMDQTTRDQSIDQVQQEQLDDRPKPLMYCSFCPPDSAPFQQESLYHRHLTQNHPQVRVSGLCINGRLISEDEFRRILNYTINNNNNNACELQQEQRPEETSRSNVQPTVQPTVQQIVQHVQSNNNKSTVKVKAPAASRKRPIDNTTTTSSTTSEENPAKKVMVVDPHLRKTVNAKATTLCLACFQEILRAGNKTSHEVKCKKIMAAKQQTPPINYAVIVFPDRTQMEQAKEKTGRLKQGSVDQLNNYLQQLYAQFKKSPSTGQSIN